MPDCTRLKEATFDRKGRIHLWMIEPVETWERLQREGTLTVDPDDPDANDPDFAHAYEWLQEQMARRLPGYEGLFPWTAYHHFHDLRSYRHSYEAGSRFVRLELALPPEQVLMSAYDVWHFVLTRSCYPQASLKDEAAFEAEMDAWNAELEAHGLEEWGDLPEPWHSRRLMSWERAFDVEALEADSTIQAWFERLSLADVVKATEFIGADREK